MNKCVDSEGNITFTAHNCDVSESKEQLYVPNAQASMSGLRTGEVKELKNIRRKEKATQRKQKYYGRTSSNTGKRLSWEERKAKKNKESDIRSQIDDIKWDMSRGAMSKSNGHRRINDIKRREDR
jgi:hypothetical protein